MSSKTLKVMTYNIHRCVGIDGRYDPARIARVLKEVGADIIGLQEVDTSLFYEPVKASVPPAPPPVPAAPVQLVPKTIRTCVSTASPSGVSQE